MSTKKGRSVAHRTFVCGRLFKLNYLLWALSKYGSKMREDGFVVFIGLIYHNTIEIWFKRVENGGYK